MAWFMVPITVVPSTLLNKKLILYSFQKQQALLFCNSKQEAMGIGYCGKCFLDHPFLQFLSIWNPVTNGMNAEMSAMEGNVEPELLILISLAVSQAVVAGKGVLSFEGNT